MVPIWTPLISEFGFGLRERTEEGLRLSEDRGGRQAREGELSEFTSAVRHWCAPPI